MAIQNIKCSATEALLTTGKSAKFSGIAVAAMTRLFYLDEATNLNDLKTPPGNGLHMLKGDRAGQHAIKVNDQFRICFRWGSDGPEDVEIIDYH